VLLGRAKWKEKQTTIAFTIGAGLGPWQMVEKDGWRAGDGGDAGESFGGQAHGS
jgi:hypothetical protein